MTSRGVADLLAVSRSLFSRQLRPRSFHFVGDENVERLFLVIKPLCRRGCCVDIWVQETMMPHVIQRREMKSEHHHVLSLGEGEACDQTITSLALDPLDERYDEQK